MKGKYSWIGRLNVIYMPVLYNYKCNANSIKISEFSKTRKLIPKFL